jgi:uncharacterized protein YecT (DUF1311 family)
MNRNITLTLFAASILVASIGALAADCNDPKSSDDVVQCLGNELRESDARINVSYQELMNKLGDSDKTALRVAQRQWINARDSICSLDAKEKNRERWYQNLLKDYAKTVCVTRFTRKRTAELDSRLHDLFLPRREAKAGSIPVVRSAQRLAQGSAASNDGSPSRARSKGKWYFEVLVNYAEIVKIEPCVLTIGVWDKQHMTGILDNIRIRDAEKNTFLYGFAVDLDNGKLYVSRNGEWKQGEPGSNLGQDLKLGRAYYATLFTSTEAVSPYLEKWAIVPNFGDRHMTYALPAGYSPWKN